MGLKLGGGLKPAQLGLGHKLGGLRGSCPTSPWRSSSHANRSADNEEALARNSAPSGLATWRPEILGWSAGIHEFYAREAERLGDGATCVEIGVYHGRSLLFLAETLHGLEKEHCCLVGVDPGDHYPNSHEILMRNVHAVSDRWPSGPFIQIKRLVSYEAAAQCEDGVVDLCFIDGDHSEEGVYRDICEWLPKMKPGSIMGGHDYNNPSIPGVKAGVHRAFATGVHHEFEWVWWIRVGEAATRGA